MKARVKATGEIVEVYCDFKGMKHDFLDYKGKGYMSDEITIFDNEDYEQGWNDGYYEGANTNTDPDYWTRLEHQYAGMAMQAMLTSPELMQVVTSAKELLTNEYAKRVAVVADRYAHALVEKMKEERK